MASTVTLAATLLAQIVGLLILAGTLAAATAAAYRWFVRETVPSGLAVLAGLSGVAAYLNTTSALSAAMDSTPTDVEVALFHILTFSAAAVGALLGRAAGDRFSTDVFSVVGMESTDDDVGRLVKTMGRAVRIQLPHDIEDVVGYDPVPEATKAELAGKTFLFPQRLTVAELEQRLIARLKTDYAVGHVDLDLADDGSIAHLGVGSRAAGIGPTLPPATNAVAVKADPAFAASSGDLVQLWETDPMRRVLTAELRGVNDDVVTLAIDAADTPKIDPTDRYRLVTLPVEDRPDREFASLLRASEESFSSVTVEAGSPLHGLAVGALDLTVIARKTEGEQPTVFPKPDTMLAAGDVLFAVARPAQFRQLEAAATPIPPEIESTVPPGGRQPGGLAPQEAPPDAPDQQQPAADQPPAAQQPVEQPTATDQGQPPEEPAAADASPAADAPAKQPAEPAQQPSEGAEPAADASAPTAEAGTDAAEPGETAGAESTGTATADDEQAVADSKPSSFSELKEDFESGEADWDEDEDAGGAATPVEESDAAEVAGGEDMPEDPEAAVSGKADASTFEDLKDDFESGDSEWDEDDGSPADEARTGGESGEPAAGADAEAADGEPSDAETDDDAFEDEDLSDLDEMETTGFSAQDMDDLDEMDDFEAEGDEFGDDEFDEMEEFDDDDGFDDDDDGFDDDDDEFGEDDDDFGDALDEAADDLEDFELDDEADEDDADDDEVADDEDADDDEDDDDEDDDEEGGEADDDDDDDDGGGGGTFAQLKEEFESGEADWEDDISDSPGGDMRLDE